MRLHSCVTSLTLFFLFTREENLRNFRKFSQEMEHPRAKWTRYVATWLKQRESITHNSHFFGGHPLIDSTIGMLQFKEKNILLLWRLGNFDNHRTSSLLQEGGKYLSLLCLGLLLLQTTSFNVFLELSS